MMLIVEKETPQGKVIAYTFESPDLCEHIPTEGMPWTVLVDAMKLDSKNCPLPAVSLYFKFWLCNVIIIFLKSKKLIINSLNR